MARGWQRMVPRIILGFILDAANAFEDASGWLEDVPGWF